MTIKLDFFGATHLGKKRSVNQDRILVSELTDATLLVVADGMGGEAAGDRAAELTVKAIKERVASGQAPGSDVEFFPWLESLVSAAQNELTTAVNEAPELSSMGTTLTMACCQWPSLFVMHVGDSRCYLLQNGKLSRITVDHTVAQRFVEEGVLSEDDAEKSPMAHQLWNVVTTGRKIEPERHEQTLSVSDAIILCSDGLTKHVKDEQIAQTVANADSAKSACSELIQMANDGGGSDNIAVVVGLFSH